MQRFRKLQRFFLDTRFVTIPNYSAPYRHVLRHAIRVQTGRGVTAEPEQVDMGGWLRRAGGVRVVVWLSRMIAVGIITSVAS
jgi:hypothetical protein